MPDIRRDHMAADDNSIQLESRLRARRYRRDAQWKGRLYPVAAQKQHRCETRRTGFVGLHIDDADRRRVSKAPLRQQQLLRIGQARQKSVSIGRTLLAVRKDRSGSDNALAPPERLRQRTISLFRSRIDQQHVERDSPRPQIRDCSDDPGDGQAR